MSTTAMNERIPLEKLKQRPDWRLLTVKQQLFIETFIASGEQTGSYDAILATQTAYNTSSIQNAKVLSYETQANPKIKRMLNLYFGKPEQDDLDVILPSLLKAIIKSVRGDLKNGSISTATMQAIKFYESKTGKKIDGLPELVALGAPAAQTAKTPETPASGYYVGQIVIEDGKKYRITKIDANGKPIEGDEVV